MKSLLDHITAGVDIGSKSLHVCVRLGERRLNQVFPNTNEGCRKLVEFARTNDVKHLVFEATGNYTRRLVSYLQQSSLSWSELNPRNVRDLGKGLGKLHKTDKADAALLADLAFYLEPKASTPRSQLHLELRDISRQITNVTIERANVKKRLKVPLRAQAAVESDNRQVAFLTGEIKVLERQWLALLKMDPALFERYQLALSVTGIGVKTARVIVSELPADLSPYSCKQLVAYCGPAPRDNASGTRVGRSWVPRTGNAHLRRAMHMPTLLATRRRPDLLEFYQLQIAKGKHHLTALTAVCRKMTYQVMTVIKRGSPWLAAAPGLQ